MGIVIGLRCRRTQTPATLEVQLQLEGDGARHDLLESVNSFVQGAVIEVRTDIRRIPMVSRCGNQVAPDEPNANTASPAGQRASETGWNGPVKGQFTQSRIGAVLNEQV